MDYSQRQQLHYYLVALGACDGLHQREADDLETIATYIGLSKAEEKFKAVNQASYIIPSTLGFILISTPDRHQIK